MSARVIDGASPPRSAGLGLAPAPGRRWPRRVALAAALVLSAALLATALVASRYQPVIFGGGFRGPSGPQLISRQVNTTGGLRGQSWLPPQPSAHGSFQISLGNTGPFPVTIESLRLLPPGLPASAIDDAWPFRIDGPPSYTLEVLRHGQSQAAPRRLAGAVLAPGEYIYVRIPFVTKRCWDTGTGWQFGGVWVTTKYLLWTRHVRISWTDADDPSQGAILSEEGYSGQHAAARLVCPQ